MKKYLSVIMFSISFIFCLMPRFAMAARTTTAPSKPLAEQIRWENIDVYEKQTVVWGGVPRASVAGKYLGVGLGVTLDTPEPDYDGFIAIAKKTNEAPANLGEGYVQNSAAVGEVYNTEVLEPETTYYLYVATYNIKSGFSAFTNLYSEWSDPVVVKTAAAKAIENNNNSSTGSGSSSSSSVGTSSSSGGSSATGANIVGSFTYSIKNNQAIVSSPINITATKLTIPATVKINGKSLSVTSIAPNAFAGMKNLTSVVIGKNVKSIGKNAFKGCSKLKKITIKTIKLTKKSIGANAFKGIHKKAVIKCPKAKKATYKKILLKKGMKKTMTFK